jgi:hypothetical protein
MAVKFAKRAGHRNQHGDKPSYMPVRAKVVDTGTPTVKHGRYSNLYSLRGINLSSRLGSVPRSTTCKRWGVK